MHQVDLAWALANAADHYLDATERVAIFIALGAGDISAAIRQLAKSATREHIELPAPIISALATWWAVHEGDRHTVALITGLPTPPPQPPARSAITRLTANRQRKRDP